MADTRRLVACFLVFLLLAAWTQAAPILKPRKYYGPIPKRSFAVRVGFITGASNSEMYDFLNRSVQGMGGQSFDTDFGNSIMVDLEYTIKLHPQFAVRTGASLKFLRSHSEGQFVPAASVDSLRPLIGFERSFNVDILSLEANAIYYFSDASVKDFQPYIGAGFSLWIPRARFDEDLTDKDSGRAYPNPGADKTYWSSEAGVQGLIGALYYLNNDFALAGEARYHIAQSRFPMKIIDQSGIERDASFIVDYTGFLITVGVLKAF